MEIMSPSLDKLDVNNLPTDVATLHEIIRASYQDVVALDEVVIHLQEELRLAKANQFASRSEKRRPAEPSEERLGLFGIMFNEAEFTKDIIPEPAPQVKAAAATEDLVQIPAHTRAKAGRKPLPANLPREEVTIDLPDHEKHCGCGKELKRIGEDISEKLEYIPARAFVRRTIRPNYACPCCSQKIGAEPAVHAAPLPPSLIERGIITASLLAHLLTSKFCDALPFYRQERILARLGIELSRTTMCNAAIAVYERWGKLLLAEMERQLRIGPLLQLDETTLQVLHEPGRAATQKSYLWAARGGPPGTGKEHGTQVVLFRYDPSRAGVVAKGIIGEFQGVVQTDGYAGYEFVASLPGVAHAGCWAHARRKFIEAEKGSGGKNTATLATQGLGYIGRIYHEEKVAAGKEVTGVALVTHRDAQVRPVLKEFLAWLQDAAGKVPPSCLAGKAINYTLNEWERLLVFLDHAEVTPDNNRCENAIRPFVVGRKNWLFASTVSGAEASAFWYSVVETAKANGLDPWKYLRFLLGRLPGCADEASVIRLLPWRLPEKEHSELV